MIETFAPEQYEPPADPRATYDFEKTASTASDQIMGVVDVLDPTEFAEKAKVFIAERLALLEAGAAPEVITYDKDRTYEGFIHPGSMVHPEAYEGEDAPGFRVDDPEMYEVFLFALRHQKESLNKKGKELTTEGQIKSFFVNGVQSALVEYFGLNEDAEAKHASMFMLDVGSEQQKSYSIAELKGKAMCIEFAAAGNNMLKLIGMQGVQLVQGRIQSENPSGPGHHAFLVIEGSEGNQKIFDPVRPEMTHDYDKGVKRIRKPAVYPGAERILDGGELTVIREDVAIHDGQSEVVQTQFTYYAR